MNKDSTYTVYLKIHDTQKPMLELKFNVSDRQTAKNIYKKWEEKAGNLYALIYDNLVDQETYYAYLQNYRHLFKTNSF